MIRDAVELLVGGSRDPQFGPVIAVGMGGVYTEVLQDFVLRIAPIESVDATAMLKELRGARILTGTRGHEPRDCPALAELIVTVSRLLSEHPEIRELDLNPVFSLENGYLVADARLIHGAASGNSKESLQ
jgi:acyl-CoA synthetase (NDP forming)